MGIQFGGQMDMYGAQLQTQPQRQPTRQRQHEAAVQPVQPREGAEQQVQPHEAAVQPVQPREGAEQQVKPLSEPMLPYQSSLTQPGCREPEPQFGQAFERRGQQPQSRQAFERRGQQPQFGQAFERREQQMQSRQAFEQRDQQPPLRQAFERRGQQPQSRQAFERRDQQPQLRQANGRQAYTVTEINRHINWLMKTDPVLENVWVKGEISNYRPHYSGHMYFSLKDAGAAIRCVMFRSAASKLRFAAENGMKVIVGGNISVFERDGQYQLYCEEIISDGLGDLHVAFEQLKNKLEAEGLFAQARKKPIPSMPKSVCLVTSPTGSVVRDMLNVALRRFPKAHIKIYPVQVQGESAAPQIARAIRAVNELALADLIIVARGGGSLEDLWAFNEEMTARAVGESAVPVISAVGHETDFTICDFAADLRAPTPSAAAELAFPDLFAVGERLRQYEARLKSALLKKAERGRGRLERCLASVVFTKPLDRTEYARMRVNSAGDKLVDAMRRAASNNKSEVAALAGRLNALSPLAVLSRGYAVVTAQKSGDVVKRAASVQVGELVRVRLQEGQLVCEAIETVG